MGQVLEQLLAQFGDRREARLPQRMQRVHVEGVAVFDSGTNRGNHVQDQESSDSETYLHKMLRYGGQFERQGLSNIDLRFLVRCWVFSFRGCGGTNGWMCRVGGRRRLYVVQRRCDYRVQRGGLHKHCRRFIG
jgi:hypothetical protein